MIKSLNATIDNDFMKELEERDEMICILNACALELTLCGGQVCAAGCFGIHA